MNSLKKDKLRLNKTKKAVERNLEIIGEALNRIIHGYDSVSPDVI